MSESIAVERLDPENSTDLLQRALHQQRYDFALERIRPEDHTLEIGTGVGTFSSVLANHCATYVGLELDPGSCELTRKKLNGRGRVVEGDAQLLPFHDQEYSTIVCLEVLEHLQDFRKAMREIHRCLRPDGKVIISVPYVKHGGPGLENEFHLYEPGEKELIDAFRMCFETVEVRYQSFPESPLMTFARRFHLRRVLGYADIYRGITAGKPELLKEIQIAPRRLGLCFNLLLVAAHRRNCS
jgi:ubiquinone/menaquinone biosynthesis C-methylase UbiE